MFRENPRPLTSLTLVMTMKHSGSMERASFSTLGSSLPGTTVMIICVLKQENTLILITIIFCRVAKYLKNLSIKSLVGNMVFHMGVKEE